jgi:hypothetical protein
VTRTELQQLALERILDAKALLAAKRWSGAYYLSGYAVECGFKACIIAYLMRTDHFPEKKFSEQCWTHNLDQLLGLTGLRAALDGAVAVDPELWVNWEFVKDWSESSRDARKTKAQAEQMYDAIANKKHGVLQWLKSCW